MLLLSGAARWRFFQPFQLGLGLELEQLRPAERSLLDFRERRQIFAFRTRVPA